jgi:archaellum component FlaC
MSRLLKFLLLESANHGRRQGNHFNKVIGDVMEHMGTVGKNIGRGTISADAQIVSDDMCGII